MATGHASSNVITFPGQSRFRAPAARTAGPVRQGGLRGALAGRLARLSSLRDAGLPQRPDVPNGSVSPLY
ncbi:MAG: hypothetical protein JJ926_14295 [Roseitalea sp.]|jgi:hypothetical protein|uniref:hypothetical protein n=1 Tax=Oceaniradius stylonematis TaxID=2184161 RepID=UPI001B25DDBD|nr:hypothetical protein [Roseitalea sp.]MBO6953391.1 hypothetical protein [Rhizobiaceae bacterium]MBO6593840.1 hypothetical protein [Roseitalea sp.]MBO6601135.1 hypothetical protein [Roseitalea sp.]MBO6613867.1 hypothetical protein [Roseitalea sp.]